MKAVLAVAFVAAGLVAAIVIWLRLSVPADVTPVPVSWSRQGNPPPVERVQFTVRGVEFVQGRTSGDEVHAFTMLRRGTDVALLPDVTEVHFVREDGQRIWAVAENTIEGPGPSVLVLFSEDGVNFTAWELKKPTYLGVVEAFEVQGDSVVVRCSGDQRMFLTDSWWQEFLLLLPSAVRPLDASDTFSFRTRDSGRTWRRSR